MSHKDDEDEVDDLQLFSLENVKVSEWCSKDRTVATIRMRDEGGMCDMKIYLILKAKTEQMEALMNFHEPSELSH